MSILKVDVTIVHLFCLLFILDAITKLRFVPSDFWMKIPPKTAIVRCLRGSGLFLSWSRAPRCLSAAREPPTVVPSAPLTQ